MGASKNSPVSLLAVRPWNATWSDYFFWMDFHSTTRWTKGKWPFVEGGVFGGRELNNYEYIWMFPKIGGKPPKWMVKIMVPNPMNKWMIWVFLPLFLVQHPYNILVYLYTLEVQPPFCIGWFPNHHCFSRGLSSSKRNHHFYNGGNDFQGIYTYYLHILYKPSCLDFMFLHRPDAGDSLQYLFCRSSREIPIADLLLNR